MFTCPIFDLQVRLESRIASLVGVESEDLPPYEWVLAMGHPSLRIQVPTTMTLGPRMRSFQAEVVRLQQIVRTCNEVQAIANMVASEGFRAAEVARESWLNPVDSDTLVGDEVANEAEDYD